MSNFEQKGRDELFDILCKEAFGDRVRYDASPEECDENLNISYRRFMVISCIDSLLRNIKYEKYWKELQELSNKALNADSCKLLFPILQDTVRVVFSISVQ